jgi:hypothetical protein
VSDEINLAFTADQFMAMPNEKRIELCRLLAAQARNMASLSGELANPIQLRMAEDWDNIAEVLERHPLN